MTDVKPDIFIETISGEGMTCVLDDVDGVVVHVVQGFRGVKFIPILYFDEDIPGEMVALYLEELGALYLLPFLVPDHPATEFAKKLSKPQT
jgi:hypothetical protein